MEDIKYIPETKDFEVSYEGTLIGYAETRREAEIKRNTYVYDLLSSSVVLDEEVLDDVVEEAVCKAPQMTVKILKAAEGVQDKPIRAFENAYLIKSASSANVYKATDSNCQCTASQFGGLCTHRIQVRLVKRALERQDTCDICQGRMILTFTPAGEDVWECRGCGHCVMVEVRRAA